MRSPIRAARAGSESAGGRKSEWLDTALAAVLPVRTSPASAAATVSRRRDRTVSLLEVAGWIPVRSTETFVISAEFSRREYRRVRPASMSRAMTPQGRPAREMRWDAGPLIAPARYLHPRPPRTVGRRTWVGG